MSPRAVLVGLPGTGKSTSGKRLAKILVLPFADSDHLVETAEGCSVGDIFGTLGEAEFRVAEARAVATALIDFDGVLALGGGALTTPATRSSLAASGVPIVLLRARLDTLAKRVGDGRTRPLLAGDPVRRLADLERERAPLYTDVATITVETDGHTPGQVAAIVAARLHALRVRS